MCSEKEEKDSVNIEDFISIDKFYEYIESFNETCDTLDFITHQKGWKYLKETEDNEEIDGCLSVQELR